MPQKPNLQLVQPTQPKQDAQVVQDVEQLNDLQIFNNVEFGNIRVIEIDNEPWFVGKDVAGCLGYSKARNAIATHVDDDDALKQGLIDKLGRMQDTILINESGLYSLIMSSKLPSAKRFKRWIDDDVMPQVKNINTTQMALNGDFSDLMNFENSEFGAIRVIDQDGKTYFCGSDVASALGYARPQNAINIHCKGALKQGIPTNGGVQQMLFIPEGDLYRLIASSQLPSAIRFEAWIFDEVLPQIRKTGGYIPVDQGDSDLMIMAKALNIMQNTLADKDSIIKALQPKADFADCMLKCNNSISVGEFAKVI
ncbi:BRO family protein [Eubacteriaceae bacterium ES3]|nr:BRO family protein [Eubacteriaceae bacterium ES3]